MAVSDNLGLYLPTREDYVSVKRDISDNFEEVDDFAGGVMNGLAIVADGDSHIQITTGQYVYVRNNANGVTEGLYTANGPISANAPIYTTSVSAVSGGISNALNSKIGGLIKTLDHTLSEAATIGANSYVDLGSLNSLGIAGKKVLGGYIDSYNDANAYGLFINCTAWYSNRYISIVNASSSPCTLSAGRHVYIYYAD